MGVSYRDCAIFQPDYFYFSLVPDEVDETQYNFCRFNMRKHGVWTGHHDLDWTVTSICSYPKIGAAVALSSDGDIHLAQTKGFEIETIPEKYRQGLGATTRIRSIGQGLFVCGHRGQVYQRIAEDDWQPIDEGLRQTELAGKTPNELLADGTKAYLEKKFSAQSYFLNDIDGVDEKHLYVVGDKGFIAYYDGQQWDILERFTNHHLNSLHVTSDGRVYVCGNDGVVFKGNAKDGFQDLSSPELADNCWDICEFKGDVYIATLNGLYTIEDDRATELDTGLEPSVGAYRFAANGDILIACYQKDIVQYDGGGEWQRILSFDNAKEDRTRLGQAEYERWQHTAAVV